MTTNPDQSHYFGFCLYENFYHFSILGHSGNKRFYLSHISQRITRSLLLLKFFNRIPDILLASKMVKCLYLVADKTLPKSIQGRSKRMGHASLWGAHSGRVRKSKCRFDEKINWGLGRGGWWLVADG